MHEPQFTRCMETNMDMRRRPENEQRRNALSVRWSDDEHRTLTDEAWKRRLSASELVRRYVSEGLRRDGAASRPAR